MFYINNYKVLVYHTARTNIRLDKKQRELINTLYIFISKYRVCRWQSAWWRFSDSNKWLLQRVFHAFVWNAKTVFKHPVRARVCEFEFPQVLRLGGFNWILFIHLFGRVPFTLPRSAPELALVLIGMIGTLKLIIEFARET